MKGFGEVPWKKKKSYLFLRQCFQNLSALQAPPTPRTRASCSLRSWGGHVQDRCGRGAGGVRSGTCGLRTSVPGTGQGDSVL